MSEGSGVGGGLVLALVVLGTGAGGLIAWQNGVFAPAAPEPDPRVAITAPDTPSAAVRQDSQDPLYEQVVPKTSATTTPLSEKEDHLQAQNTGSEPNEINNTVFPDTTAPEPDVEPTQATAPDSGRSQAEQELSDQTSEPTDDTASALDTGQVDPSRARSGQPESSETHSVLQQDAKVDQTESKDANTDRGDTAVASVPKTESRTPSDKDTGSGRQTNGSPGDEARQSPSALPTIADVSSTVGTTDALPMVQDDPAQMPSRDVSPQGEGDPIVSSAKTDVDVDISLETLPSSTDTASQQSNRDAVGPSDESGPTTPQADTSVEPQPDNTEPNLPSDETLPADTDTPQDETTAETSPSASDNPSEQQSDVGSRDDTAAATDHSLPSQSIAPDPLQPEPTNGSEPRTESQPTSPSQPATPPDATTDAQTSKTEGNAAPPAPVSDEGASVPQDLKTEDSLVPSPDTKAPEDTGSSADPAVPAKSTQDTVAEGTEREPSPSQADPGTKEHTDSSDNAGLSDVATGGTSTPDGSSSTRIKTEGTSPTDTAAPDMPETGSASPNSTNPAAPKESVDGDKTSHSETVKEPIPPSTTDVGSTPNAFNETSQEAIIKENKADDAALPKTESTQSVEVIATKSSDGVEPEQNGPITAPPKTGDTSDTAGSSDAADTRQISDTSGIKDATETSEAAVASEPTVPLADTSDVTDLAMLAPDPSTSETNATTGPSLETDPPVRENTPRFDQVRFDPAGFTVIAGRAHPRVEVAALLDGQIQDVTFTDGNGQFAMLLLIESSPVARVLSLRVYQDGSEIDSLEQVILAPTPAVRPQLLDTTDTPAFAKAPTSPPSPAAPQTSTPGGTGRDIGPSRLATAHLGTGLSDEQPTPKGTPAPQPKLGGTAQMNDPAQGGLAPAAPTQEPMPSRGTTVLLTSDDGVRVLQTPQPPGAPPETSTTLSLQTIAYDEQGEVSISGRGSESGFVRIYLNNKAVSQLAVGQDGSWTAELQGIDTGIYTLRVDQLSEGGDVLSRVESPFKREDRTVLARARELSGPITAITIQPGNTLWGISRERYGRGVLYVHVYEANRSLIRDPDLIYPGQVFDLPETVPETIPDVLP
ncbi:MAG: LysM peptidoglycan-binding domain-containing protein [Pseudoprimorskyibacter sp.]|nr:LysM peptidoglycan-binding domain-containing protein [Pseudoprimorskyibacter sp.]